MQQFEAGRGSQRRLVIVGSAPPAQVGERRSQAFPAVKEAHQDIGGDVDA
jgi:hypothetical protein